MIRIALSTGQVLSPKNYHRVLCYAVHVLSRDQSSVGLRPAKRK